MAGAFSQTIWEYGTKAESSKTTVHIPTLNAGNIAAQLALIETFQAAVLAVSLGNSGSDKTLAVVNEVARNPSLNPIAQRENKWLVSYRDVTTNLPGSYTIPCYNPALLAADGESMDTASDEYADLVAASDALVRSNAGNVTEVTSIVFRARNI